MPFGQWLRCPLLFHVYTRQCPSPKNRRIPYKKWQQRICFTEWQYASFKLQWAAREGNTGVKNKQKQCHRFHSNWNLIHVINSAFFSLSHFLSQFCEWISTSVMCKWAGPIIDLLLEHVGHVQLCSKLTELLDSREEWLAVKRKSCKRQAKSYHSLHANTSTSLFHFLTHTCDTI